MSVVTRVVTPSNYGAALHCGLLMFAEFEKLPYPSVISISAFPLASLEFIRCINKTSSTNSASSSNVYF